MSAGRIGCMTTPAQGSRIPPGALYACDNSKFGSDGKGRYWPGAEKWFAWLSRTVDLYGPDRCLWALAPDEPFDAVATLTESVPWLAQIRELDIPAAFAAQDGCDHPGLIPWDSFDVLFLAGTTAWKLGPVAERLAREARVRGKSVHMGASTPVCVWGSPSGSAATASMERSSRTAPTRTFPSSSAGSTNSTVAPHSSAARIISRIPAVRPGFRLRAVRPCPPGRTSPPRHRQDPRAPGPADPSPPRCPRDRPSRSPTPPPRPTTRRDP